jgi:hypothetical protein
MRIFLQLVTALGLFTLFQPVFAPALSAAELTDEQFARLLKQLQPADDEAWLTIPWKIRLLDARKTALEEHRPIFIWAMDGHPLGCT